jgi:hypothetical protein
MMKKYLFCLLFVLLLAVPGWATDYEYFFAAGGSGTTCSEGSPCAFSYTSTILSNYSASGNTLTLNLNGGDTWTATSSTMLGIDKSNITVQSYGTGKAILDGDLNYPSSHTTFLVSVGDDSGSSVTNIEFKNLIVQNAYPGGGLQFAGTGNGDYFTGHALVEGCEFDDIGWAAISIYKVGNSAGSSGAIKIENCKFTTINEYCRIEEYAYGWPQAVQTNVGDTWGHEIRHCVVNDVFGEGIGSQGFAITEYNQVSGTKAPGIYVSVGGNDFSDTKTIVRYNMVWGDTNTSYTGSSSGIRLDDEGSGGSNANAEIEIYGNLVGGGLYAGIDLRNGSNTSDWPSVKVYNNTIVDTKRNLAVAKPSGFANAIFTNNLSVIFTEADAQHFSSWGDSDWSGWTFGPNMYDNDDAPASPYGTNVVLGDSVLGKTSGWRSLTSCPSLDDFTPQDGSDMIDNANTADLGDSYDEYLNSGEFSDLPDDPDFTLADQDDYGDEWDFGAIIYGTEETQIQTIGSIFETLILRMSTLSLIQQDQQI